MRHAAAFFALVIIARGAFACSCVTPPSVEQALLGADAVFAGVVEKIEDKPRDTSSIEDLPRTVTFRVLQWWKAPEVTESFVVKTGFGGGDCGYPVEEGQREQPYTTYWRPCITAARLIGSSNGLSMNRHCRFKVDAVITRDGTVRDFQILQRPPAFLDNVCPASLDPPIIERVASWKFRPATLNGVPIETRLTNISPSEPSQEKPE